MEIKERVKRICEKNGFDIDNAEERVNIDSLTYISTIVEIEGEFEIEFPDYLLEKNAFEDVDNLYALIEMLPQRSEEDDEEEEEDDDEERDPKEDEEWIKFLENLK